MELKNIKKSKLHIVALFLITLIVLTNIIAIAYALPKLSDEPVPNYLYQFAPENDFYEFKAEGECYIIADVINTDFSSFYIDEEEYFEVNYGFNAIPIKFSDNLEIHNITLQSNTHFQTLAIEPLFIAEGEVEVSLVQTWGRAIIEFNAGGLISILLKPNFSFNLLFVQIDAKVLKDEYDEVNYPKIDSQLYSYFIEGGAYIRFDYEILNPKTHVLILQGNGTIEYKIMANYDWDGDALPDVLEVQKEMFNDLDPVIPNYWGFFEKSDEAVLIDTSGDSQPRHGYFSFYVPDSGPHFLTIMVENGEYFDIVFDGNSESLKNIIITEGNIETVDIYGSGWHYIKYKYFSNYNKIKFYVDTYLVKVLNFPELRDTDGDGIKDFQENNDNLNQDVGDSDGDGLPDNFDASPFASLSLNPNKIHRFLIPTDTTKNSIITVQIKKPQNDYSTKGIPRLWRDALNVSIYPALRLFGNEFQLWGDSAILPLMKGQTGGLWGKSFMDYNLVSDYDTTADARGDAFPKATEQNGESWFVFPNSADETLEFEFTFSKNNPAKSDGVLDIRFDIIWLLTYYKPDTKETNVLHYYNFEENMILQSLTLREIGDINYLLGTPDNYVENQILWTLTQNPNIGEPEDFGVDDDIIGQDTVDYLSIADETTDDMRVYYENNPNRPKEAEITYLSGLQHNYDLLDKLELGLGSSLLNRGDFTTAFSCYSINNVYDDYIFGDDELQGEYTINYKIASNLFQNSQKVATILGMPLAMERLSFTDSNILKVTNAISEPIPLSEIPFSITPDMNPSIKLQKQTTIEKKSTNEVIPTVHFDHTNDIQKEYLDNRNRQLKQGNIFFEGDSTAPSKASIFNDFLEDFQQTLSAAHDVYGYFNTENGEIYYPGDPWDPYREFDYFLNNYLGADNRFLTDFLMDDVDTKLGELNNLEIEISDMVEQHRDIYIEIRTPANEDPSSSSWEEKWDFLSATNEVNVECTKGFKRAYIKAGGTQAYTVGKTTSRGRAWGKLKYVKDRLETSCAVQGVIAGVQIGLGAYGVWTGVTVLMKLWAEGAIGDDLVNLTNWATQVALGVCSVVVSAFSIVEGVILIYDTFKDAVTSSMSNAKSFLCKAGYVIAFVMIAIDWVGFLVKLSSGDLTGREITYQFVKLSIETGFALAGIAIGAAIGGTGVGIVVGLAMMLVSLLGGWLTSALNNPSIDVQECYFYFDTETKLNIRRHGSLEAGNHMNFHLKVYNDGDRPGWLRAKYRTRQQKSGGWSSSWDGWHQDPSWSNEWYEPPFRKHETFDSYSRFGDFKASIPYPTVNLHYNLQLQYDWQKFELIILIPTWWREDGAREDITEPVNMPVLDNSISQFYDDTTELMSTSLLKEEFESAVMDYQWKDAYDAATEIISRTNKNAKTSLEEFLYLEDGTQIHNDNYYVFHSTSQWKFQRLLMKYYGEGFRAKILHPFSAFGEGLQNLLSYDTSGGDILIPRDTINLNNDWFYIKRQELGDVIVYYDLRLLLPLSTNIKTDLRENPIDIDPETQMAQINFDLYLEGTENPPVNYIITPPENFSISPNSFTKSLRDSIHLTITQDNPNQLMGLYYFELNITYSNQIIYSSLVPIRIKGLSKIEYVEHIPPEPIEPGEPVNLLDVINSGTIPDSVYLTIEGLPEHFICKDFYPDEFDDGVQKFNIGPGESRGSVIINPPRHYTTLPGIYEFHVTAINPMDDSIHFEYDGSFEIVVYHELLITCTNPDQLIYDYENATYNFEVTNLGNMDEDLLVSYGDVSFATSKISSDNFLLAPGETQSFSIELDPFYLGSENFQVKVSNEFVSSELICSLKVIDDDPNDPYFENIQITDDCNWVNINFQGLDELLGDDMGLSLIEIYVDGKLISFYSPDPSETDFSFSLINQWIWEVTNEFYNDGQITHEIRVFIVDADEDREGDYLMNEFIEYFEVTLDEMYDYVVWLLGEVNQYIYDNSLVALYGTITQKLVRVQDLLVDAYQLIEAGQLHTGLVRNKIAEAKLEIAESKAELKALKDQVGEPYISEILSMMHNIRNKIVELMGRSVGTEFSHEISLTEVDLYDLRDLIEKNINETDRESLFNIIALAASKLENAIFDISLDKDTEDSMIQALHALDHAKAEVFSLYRKGKISEVLRETLIQEITILQAKIYQLIDDF